MWREEMEAPKRMTRNRGTEGKARGGSHGPAETLKLRLLLYLLKLSLFFLWGFCLFICFFKKVPSGKDSLNSRCLSKTFLELRLTYPVWRQSAILIRWSPFGGWGFWWLNFIKESVGGQCTRTSELRSIWTSLPKGLGCLFMKFHLFLLPPKVVGNHCTREETWPPLDKNGLWSSWIRAS